MTYLEEQFKQKNLVFHGMEEKKGETWGECKEAVRNLIKEQP